MDSQSKHKNKKQANLPKQKNKTKLNKETHKNIKQW